MSDNSRELNTYTYTDSNGNEVTAQLTEEDAKRRGAKAADAEEKGAGAPATKARKAADNK